MGKFVDLTGQRFGRLTVLSRTLNKGKYTRWLCRCDCGNEKEVLSYCLKRGETTSCGCYHKEQAATQHTKHGGRYDALYGVWIAMRDRCYNPRNKDYPDYGSRGICVCAEWLDKDTGYKSFREWATGHGYAKSLSIERINVNGNYEPENCRWATQKEQCNNKRNNHLISFGGKTQTMTQWADELGMNSRVLENRINRYHWDIEKALTTPTKSRK